MSHTKKNRSVFLLSKLKPFDYLLVLGAMAFLLALYGYLRIYNEPGMPSKYAAQLVPVRSIEAAYNISQLWGKENIYLSQANYEGRFFVLNGRSLVFPTLNELNTLYALRAIDLGTGQDLWKTDMVGYPGTLRSYDSMLFVLSNEWLEQAPVRDNKELPYCSFNQKNSLSAYNADTGEQLWSYGYQGVSVNYLNFEGKNAYLTGTSDHGESGLLVQIEINSGMILSQQCARVGEGKPVPVPPRNSVYGISESSFLATAVDNQEYDFGCMDDNRLCFVTQENRLNILGRNTRETLAFIEFNGEKLNPYYVDIIVQNNLLIVHLNDSNQLFAFRLPF